jgi:hypothetical protein
MHLDSCFRGNDGVSWFAGSWLAYEVGFRTLYRRAPAGDL